MGCVSSCLCLLHTVTAIIALALVATGGYLLATGQQSLADSSAQYAWTAWVPLLLGLVLFVLALCACSCDIKHRGDCLNIPLAILQLVVAVAVITAGASLIVLSVEYLPTISSAARATEGKCGKFYGVYR